FGHSGHAQAAAALGLLTAIALAQRWRPSARLGSVLALVGWGVALVLLHASARIAAALPVSSLAAGGVGFLAAALLFLASAPLLVSELEHVASHPALSVGALALGAILATSSFVSTIILFVAGAVVLLLPSRTEPEPPAHARQRAVVTTSVWSLTALV